MTSTQMQTISHGVMSAMAKPDKGLGPLGLFQYFRRNEIILNHAEPQGPPVLSFSSLRGFPICQCISLQLVHLEALDFCSCRGLEREAKPTLGPVGLKIL